MTSERMLTDEFIKAHPLDAARILDGLGIDEVISFLKDLPPQFTAKVLRYLEPTTAARCLEGMEAKKTSEVAARLPLEDSALLLRRVGGKRRDEILEALPDEVAGPIKLILHFPEGTAGALMDPEVFTLPDDITVREALKRVQKLPEHLIYYIFVLNRDHVLLGFVNIRQLMQSRPDDSISSLVQRPTARLFPYMHRQAILANPGWREIHVLPVVDEKGVFLGAIGYGTLKRLESEERETPPAGGANNNNVAAALGELYWIGLSALLRGAAAVLGKHRD